MFLRIDHAECKRMYKRGTSDLVRVGGIAQFKGNNSQISEYTSQNKNAFL